MNQLPTDLLGQAHLTGVAKGGSTNNNIVIAWIYAHPKSIVTFVPYNNIMHYVQHHNVCGVCNISSFR